MANTYKALQTFTVGAGGASSITFSNIPQTYTDLKLVYSARTDYAGTTGEIGVWINSDTFPASTNFWKSLEGNGSSASSNNNSTYAKIGNIPGSTATGSTFGNGETYFPNYCDVNNYKCYETNHVAENYATTSNLFLGVNSRNINGNITQLILWSSGNFVQYSTFTLYGVFNADVSATPAIPTIGTATAGTQQASITFTPVSNAASYTMTSTPGNITATGTTSPIVVTGLTGGTPYTFKVKANNPFGSSGESAASNSVTPTSPFSVSYLVLAGGGSGGGQNNGGGGGAGGYLESSTSVAKSTNYTVTVGAGGASTTSEAVKNNGNNSVFSSITANGGGAGGGQGATGNNGGCGGGSAYAGNQSTGGTGSQGGNGGGGANSAPNYGGGGGGGAAPANGGQGTASSAGQGGAGKASSITGSSVTRGGGGSGGNGGGSVGGGAGGGGTGAGGASGPASAGGANLGGGGGGCQTSYTTGAAGGSGVVILRWATSSGTITIGAGLTGSTSTVGSDTVATITGGTGNVSWS
jgi:hypothetical protein